MNFRWPRWLMKQRGPAYRIVDAPDPPRIVFAKSCFEGMVDCLASTASRRHEGVVLLLGRGDGAVKLAMQCVRPVAITSAGSFSISAAEMARVIHLATKLGLEIVAQVHTHPGEAYHSPGDDEGARIRYDGYLSLVIPDYGIHLPDLTGSAIYAFSSALGWEQLPSDAVQIVDGAAIL